MDSIISQFERTYNKPIERWRQVNNLTERDAIPGGVRYAGMEVFVISEGQTYILGPGVTNGDWDLYGGTGVNGTFTTTDGKTITVVNGLINSIL